MERFRSGLAVAVAVCETVLNAAALALCWWGAFRLLGSGRAALDAGGRPPMELQAAVAAAMSPAVIDRVLYWGLGAVYMGVAGVLALSAAEGSWWMARRLSSRRSV